MNCPHHIHLQGGAAQLPHPSRSGLRKFGTGSPLRTDRRAQRMTRVRGFTQDDAHLFITPEQVESELRPTSSWSARLFDRLALDYRVRLLAIRPARSTSARRRPGNTAQASSGDRAPRHAVHRVEVKAKLFMGRRSTSWLTDCIGREWRSSAPSSSTTTCRVPLRPRVFDIGSRQQAAPPRS